MANPTREIEFRKIFGSVGNFGGTVGDVSRPGIDGHTYKYLGKRGSVKQVRAIQFFTSQVLAEQFRTVCHAAQGFETTIIDKLDGGARYRVMLQVVDIPEPIKIGSSETGIEWKIEATLSCTRTI